LTISRCTASVSQPLRILISVLKKPPAPRLEPRTLFRDYGLFTCNLSVETNSFVIGAVLLLCLVSEVQKPSSPGLDHMTVFGGLAFVSVVYSPKKSNFGLGAIFLLCLVSEVHKPSSPVLDHRTVFRGSTLSLINVLFERNNFDLGAVLLWCLVSELQEQPSFRSFEDLVSYPSIYAYVSHMDSFFQTFRREVCIFHVVVKYITFKPTW
jgi:hypothetical protein